MLLSPEQTRALYQHAATTRYAVLAVNADSPAAIVDCLIAARECDAPIIIETTAAVNPTASNLAKFGPIRGALDSTWHYIRYGDGREELFAWRTDPEEIDDRFPTPAGAAVAERYRSAVARELTTERAALSTRH